VNWRSLSRCSCSRRCFVSSASAIRPSSNILHHTRSHHHHTITTPISTPSHTITTLISTPHHTTHPTTTPSCSRRCFVSSASAIRPSSNILHAITPSSHHHHTTTTPISTPHHTITTLISTPHHTTLPSATPSCSRRCFVSSASAIRPSSNILHATTPSSHHHYTHLYTPSQHTSINYSKLLQTLFRLIHFRHPPLLQHTTRHHITPSLHHHYTHLYTPSHHTSNNYSKLLQTLFQLIHF